MQNKLLFKSLHFSGNQLQVIFHLESDRTKVYALPFRSYPLRIVSRSTVEVGLALIIRFALETFPVISIYHLAKASISERPRLYLLFSYSVEIASLLSLSPSKMLWSYLHTRLSQQCAGCLLIKMPGSSKGEEGVNRMALVMVLGPPSDKFSVFAHP